MATEPAANRRSAAGSLDERGNEVSTEGEMDAHVGNNPLLTGKISPKAAPEDIGLEAPESEATTHAIGVDSVDKMAERAEMDEKCREVNQSPSESDEGEVENHPDGIDESARVAEEGTPAPSPCNDPPPPAEGGAAPPPPGDSIGDVEVLSNPKEEDSSSDSQDSQERQPTPYLSDPVTREAAPPVEVEEDRVRNDETTGKRAEGQVQKIPEGQQHRRKPEDVSPEALEISTQAIHRRLSRNSSDDAFTIESPEGAGDENQTVDRKPLDIPSARRQWVRLDVAGSKAPRPRSSRSSSSSLVAEDTAQPAVPPEGQQGEQQLPSNQSSQELDNQEATQQVFSQGSLPPATVATAPANQGEAGSQGCARVVMTERQKGEEERGEGAVGGQTGGEKGQKVSGVNEGKAEEEEEEQKASDAERVEIERQKADRPIPGLNSEGNTASGMDTDLYDDSQSDSGVSADFSPNTTVELNYVPDAAGSSASETPIEREIRRAVQREQSLRRSRGLQHQTAPEYVDIPLRKSILTQTLPSKFESSQTKDRHFAGKKMQKEIHVETQREQVLVQLGKVPGFYDKGTVRQLKDRKKLFEAFQEPRDDSSNLSLLSNAPSWVSAGDLSALELPGDDSSDGSTIGGSFADRRMSLDPLSRTQSPGPVAARDGGFTYIPHGGPGLTEGTKRQVIILDNPLELPVPTLYHARLMSPSGSSESLTEPPDQTAVDSAPPCASSTDREESWRTDDSRRNAEAEEEEEEVDVPRENPFFKLRTSVTLDVVGQDIREARERERELRRQRSSMYGGAAAGAVGAGGGGRERVPPSPTPPPPAMNGLATPDPPVTPLRMSSGTPTVRQSLGKLGMWPPPQASEEESNQLEVIQSPQTPRQKTPLLQRWESGLVNGHREGEED